jgi:putative ABC transport system permease protein
MSLWRHLARGLRVLIHRDVADQDLADEVRHYLDESTAAYVARGLSPADARRAANIELGNATVAREQIRAYGWENVIDMLLADLRYAGRRLRKSPGFAAIAVVTLALGIGASTAIFSAVNPILFEPLPYPQAARILAISDRLHDGARLDVTFGTYRELAARGRSFDVLAVMDAWHPALTGTAEPERLEGQLVSATCFRAFGIAPAVGRDFEDVEAQPGGPRVAILSDRLVRRRFGGRPDLVGQSISLDGDHYTVIGILPAGFENVLAPLAEIWAPLKYRQAAPFNSAEWGHHLTMIGRLRPAVTTDQARRELEAIARMPLQEFPRAPWAALRQGLIVTALRDDVTRGVKPVLIAIVGAVILVLAIACVNVTNLLLTRSVQRRGELAMRAALGAGRARLIRQLLTESLLLAVLGGALGLGVAQLGIGALVALSPPGLPRANAIRLDAAVFVFALGITTLIGLVVGLLPALQASNADIQSGVQQSSRTTAGGHHRARRGLVVAEVALALVLLAGAGLLVRTLVRLFAVPPGFEASHVLTMQIQDAGHRYEADTARYQFFERALEAVRRVPGVAAASFTSQLPLSGDLDKYGVQFESVQYAPNEDSSALRYAITPDYIETMGIPLRRGRLLNAHDLPGAPEAILINESFARRTFQARDPVGQRVRLGPEIGHPERPWDIIVGVVGDVKQTSLAVDDEAAFYVTTRQWWWFDTVQTLVVRTPLDPAALTPAITRAIWSVDKDQPIARIATMEQLLERSESERRFAAIIFEAFALAALALAAIGVYGVLSGSVIERTREIGVRSALGASRADIVGMIVRQGMALTGFGVAIGLSGAAAASGVLVTLLFGVSRLDPATYIGVIALLAAVSALACWVPAARAARIDPADVLRDG